LSRFRRGEVWLVDLGMAANVRPCLVLSVPPADEDRALVTLVPHTTSVRESSFESVVRVPFLREGAFDAQGLVTVPQVKLLRRLGKLQSDQLQQVERSVARWLGFSSHTGA
jgi:mRNA interferase MazF